LDANANIVTSDGGNSIKIARDVGAINMECLYDSEVTLTEGIGVEESSLTATNAVTSTGSNLITSQLQMKFYDAATEAEVTSSSLLSIGEVMEVGISFVVPGNIPGSVFGFYPTDCTVTGTDNEHVIMGEDCEGCLDDWSRNHLQLAYVSPYDVDAYATADAEMKFEFELFSFEGDSSLSLACDVTVCIIGESCPVSV